MAQTLIPTKTMGPILLTHPFVSGEVHVPLATYESPLWPSVNRGAKVTRLAGGIYTDVVSECMARSIVLRARDLKTAVETAHEIQANAGALAQVVKTTSRFAEFIDVSTTLAGNLIYVRITLDSKDASGQNMVTKAADAILSFLLDTHSHLEYVSISGNLCTDKKTSAVNGLLGRGRHVVAQTIISRALCEKHLRTTPEALRDLHINKNLTGGVLAGSLRSANAHFANMLLAFYLATGQDAANIVEGSQGMTHVEVRDDQLIFSVDLPNVIIGTVGTAKNLPHVTEHLAQLGCTDTRNPGENARRLAHILGATVLCGELSLMAAQSNLGELMRCHELFERKT